MQDIYFSSPPEVIAQSADSLTVNLTYTETRRVPSVVDLETDIIEVNMALVLPFKQGNANYGTRHNKKYSSPSYHRERDSVQSRPKKDDQNLDPQNSYRVIIRKWPTWPNLEALAQKAAGLNNVNNEASYDHLAPMERWRMETQQQSPWNGVAAVNAVKKERYGEFELSPEDGGQIGDTENGSWTPVFETN